MSLGLILTILASLLSTEAVKKVVETVVKALSSQVDKLGYLPKLVIGVLVSVVWLAVGKSLGLPDEISASVFAATVTGAYELVHKLISKYKEKKA